MTDELWVEENMVFGMFITNSIIPLSFWRIAVEKPSALISYLSDISTTCAVKSHLLWGFSLEEYFP